MPSEKHLEKMNRGTSIEMVATIDVVWNDNKVVSLLSTLTGINLETKIERFDKLEWKMLLLNVLMLFNIITNIWEV